jgi:hypothetical protein
VSLGRKGVAPSAATLTVKFLIVAGSSDSGELATVKVLTVDEDAAGGTPGRRGRHVSSELLRRQRSAASMAVVTKKPRLT